MKHHFQRLLPFVFALASVATLQAEPVEMYIWTKDGSKTTLQLTEKPRLTFTANEMSVATTAASVELPFSQLDKITYSSSQSEGIGSVPADDGHQTFMVADDGSFLFQADRTPLQVMVVSMSGALLKHFTLGVEGRVSLPAALLPGGSYLVVVNGITYKIMKL